MSRSQFVAWMLVCGIAVFAPFLINARLLGFVPCDTDVVSSNSCPGITLSNQCGWETQQQNCTGKIGKYGYAGEWECTYVPEWYHYYCEEGDEDICYDEFICIWEGGTTGCVIWLFGGYNAVSKPTYYRITCGD